MMTFWKNVECTHVLVAVKVPLPLNLSWEDIDRGPSSRCQFGTRVAVFAYNGELRSISPQARRSRAISPNARARTCSKARKLGASKSTQSVEANGGVSVPVSRRRGLPGRLFLLFCASERPTTESSSSGRNRPLVVDPARWFLFRD